MSRASDCLSKITFTGVGEATDLKRTRNFLQNPRVEFAVLLASHIAGTEALYPSKKWIKETTQSISGNWALHVCWPMAMGELVLGKLDKMVEPFGRIQINGKFPRSEQRLIIEAVCKMYPNKQIITQFNKENSQTLATPVAKNHAILLDASSGKGIETAAWQVPTDQMPVGFAGGLGPDNLAMRLPEIARLARAGAWVDMQGKLRTTADPWAKDGQMDLDKCARAVEIFEGFLASH